MNHEPTHIYEVMFIDELNDKEERISVHLTEKSAREMQDIARAKLYVESSYYPNDLDLFNEDYSWYIKTTPILP